jgi:hypothetical protein
MRAIDDGAGGLVMLMMVMAAAGMGLRLALS